MPSTTVENYLKQIYLAGRQSGEELVPMGRVAEAVGVTAGTATSMAKALADAQLVEYEPRTGVRLTPEGDRQAVSVLRRHRLIELFLVEVLGLDWSQVHEEAEVLEHAISDKVLERIDAYLGHPDADPHGDPIPPAEGAFEHLELPSLADCALDTPLTIARVTDQSTEFLQFAEHHGLQPGASVVVTSRNPTADAVTVQPADKPQVTLGAAAAEKFHVRIPE